jgi:prevent-host-death family protein
MKSVAAYEAKTHLPKLLARVAKGERILITRHGAPVAVLQSPAAQPTADVAGTIAKLKAYRKGNRLRGLSVRKMIAEGRR